MYERYQELYRLYADFDVGTLREYRDFVDLFPPLDSPIALDRWQDVKEEMEEREAEIRDAFEAGDAFADIAGVATRDQAFTALDLYTKYERMVTALVVDVDETLRSAGGTDNEIPRETLHQLTELHESGMPIVVCTGQTLENVKGFAIQGLGDELVYSGDLSIVYEGGSGVFTPGQGARTKQLLYEDLPDEVIDRFQTVRSQVVREMPSALRSRTHLQGNEFNVTIKPNDETGSDRALTTIRTALPHLLDQLGSTLTGAAGYDEVAAYYADADPEIEAALDAVDALPDEGSVPATVRESLADVDVAYYRADAVELTSRKLNKVVGVKAAFDVLGVEDPFAMVLGDSKSDLRVMRWLDEEGIGIGAAPEHASEQVVEFVADQDDLVFDRGAADQMLRTLRAMARIADVVDP
ncbi:MAG: HAD family hydrolase [Halanaeroarchaeum sp.]